MYNLKFGHLPTVIILFMHSSELQISGHLKHSK